MERKKEEGHPCEAVGRGTAGIEEEKGKKSGDGDSPKDDGK